MRCLNRVVSMILVCAIPRSEPLELAAGFQHGRVGKANKEDVGTSTIDTEPSPKDSGPPPVGAASREGPLVAEDEEADYDSDAIVGPAGGS